MSGMFTDQFGPVSCHDDVRYAVWNVLDGERKGDYDQRDGAELRILATDAALRLALATATKEAEAYRAERDAAVARLNRIREWAGGLGWLGSPQDERVETEALAILDSVDRWQSCPDYIRGLPHTECAKCGGFGAVPAPQKGAPE